VARILLERIYEPIFLKSSHGFRPKKSCHTALQAVKNSWTGVKWLIEVAVKSFFDNINHEKLMALLEKRIDDRRFLRLMRLMLQAGYMEDWKCHRTYSGTPQGGVITLPTKLLTCR
jgi:RNA-directed DNA polymerase